MSSVWFSDGSIVPADYIYIGMLVELSSVSVESNNGESILTADLRDGVDVSGSYRLCDGFLGVAQAEWLYGKLPEMSTNVIFALPFVEQTAESLSSEGVGGILSDSRVLVEVMIDGELKQFIGNYDSYCRLMSNLQKFKLFMLQSGWKEEKVEVNAYLDSVADLKLRKITVLECSPREWWISE